MWMIPHGTTTRSLSWPPSSQAHPTPTPSPSPSSSPDPTPNPSPNPNPILAAELPPGAVVVHNNHAGYEGSRKYRLLETLEVACSWNAQHPVIVHVRK